MKNHLLTNEQAQTLANFLYSYLNDYVETNEKAFRLFISNIKKKGMMNNV